MYTVMNLWRMLKTKVPLELVYEIYGWLLKDYRQRMKEQVSKKLYSIYPRGVTWRPTEDPWGSLQGVMVFFEKKFKITKTKIMTVGYTCNRSQTWLSITVVDGKTRTTHAITEVVPLCLTVSYRDSERYYSFRV